MNAVMQRARADDRIIVTFDSDYGELVFRRRLPTPGGVLYLRFLPENPLEPVSYIAGLIAAKIELEGRFTTADRNQVRQRPLDTH